MSFDIGDTVGLKASGNNRVYNRRVWFVAYVKLLGGVVLVKDKMSNYHLGENDWQFASYDLCAKRIVLTERL